MYIVWRGRQPRFVVGPSFFAATRKNVGGDVAQSWGGKSELDRSKPPSEASFNAFHVMSLTSRVTHGVTYFRPQPVLMRASLSSSPHAWGRQQLHQSCRMGRQRTMTLAAASAASSEWLKLLESGGATCPACEMRPSMHGNGLFTTKSVKQGEVSICSRDCQCPNATGQLIDVTTLSLYLAFTILLSYLLTFLRY